MVLPFTSLDAATATGPGSSNDLEGSFDHHTMIASQTGLPTYARVAFEGSHDEVTWISFGYVELVPGPAVVTVPQTSAPGTLFRYVRANLTSLTGGTSPTVTATIASDTNEED